MAVTTSFGMKNKVIIYSTPWCGYCKMAKEYFKKHDIEYVEYDISTDKEKQKELVDKTQQIGVPVFDIGGKLVIGFDRDKVEELLGL
ncbi:MAG: glutaredoxin-like protein [Parcubacteria group bacterium Licking1014_17]|nr:MAG: glutaredoxin-like protein [Parcubacteria group bacterium Licking1014_17]